MGYTVSDIMLMLIRCEICGGEFPEKEVQTLNERELEELYELSKKHDMAHVVGYCLLSNEALPEGNLKTAFSKEQMTAVFRHAQIRHELSRVCRAFASEGIEYMPLKGSVIRKYYPKPEFRTSCDIDIFLHPEDIERASAVVTEKLGYKFDIRTAHDVAFYSPSRTHVELHFDLIEENEDIRAALTRVWHDSVSNPDFPGGKLMSPEMFITYHFAHMAKHFLGGGCGVRPLLDLWIIGNKIPFDDEKLDLLLSECKLRKFALEMMNLSEVWFCGAEHNEITRETSDYILGAGVYGKLENRIAIAQSSKKGKFGYICSRIFLPYSQMKRMYPRLEKYPLLLPFYEVKRWFRFFARRGTSAAKREMRLNSAVTSEKKERLATMCKSLELSDKR